MRPFCNWGGRFLFGFGAGVGVGAMVDGSWVLASWSWIVSAFGMSLVAAWLAMGGAA
jgi:hypothetical protein